MGTKKWTWICWQCPQVLKRDQQCWIPLQDVHKGSCMWAPGHVPSDPTDFCCTSPPLWQALWHLGEVLWEQMWHKQHQTTVLSYSPRVVTHMKGFVHKDQDKQATCSLPQGTRHKLVKPRISFSGISISRLPTEHKKKIHSSEPGMQDELQELLCVHPLLEVLTRPSDLKIHGWVLFTVAELR